MLKVLTALLLVLSSSEIFSLESSIKTREVENMSEKERETIQSLSEMLSDLSDEEREMTVSFFSLDWKDIGAYKLKQSNSTISLPEGYKLLIGEEAKKENSRVVISIIQI